MDHCLVSATEPIIQMSLLKEILQFLKEEKKWWLIPLAVLLLLAVVVVLLLASSSGISWTLYQSK